MKKNRSENSVYLYPKYNYMSFPSILFTLPFSEIIGYIDENYMYKPSAFTNGNLVNESNENQGSAKVLYFARLHNLSDSDTLRLFAEHYESVLKDASGTSHQNIRNFMKHGWKGISFQAPVLEDK